MLANSLFAMGSCSSNDEPEIPVNPENPTESEAAGTMVIYEANPRFFATDNCLNAINARLDEIKELGTTVLWIMPVCEPGELKSVGSPYCIKDYKAVNQRYGTVADLKSLVDNAHSKGMDVILDWVANHTSWDNKWITEHPDWYTQDGQGNIISPEGQNWTDVADLNFDNAEMRAAMIDAMKFWITETGIDGFRCDYTDGVPHDFWAEAIKELRAIDSDLFMLSESEGSDYLADGFDMYYDWSYATLVKNLFNGGNIENFFDKAEELLAPVDDASQVMRYVYNHDVAMSNTLASLYGGADALPAAYALTTLLDGTPLVYSSMETELSNNSTLSFFNYNPLTWNDNKAEVYATINQIYAATADARGGDLKTYSTGDVVTFARVNGSHSMLVMVNPTKATASVKVPITYSGTTMRNMLTSTDEELPVAIELDGYGYAIYYK